MKSRKCTHVLVLSKGIVLYSGSVHGMSSNEGFFELQAGLIFDSNSKYTSCHESIKKKRKRFCISKSPLEAAKL
jgi:ABC-2 type transport system ATP-binding protein